MRTGQQDSGGREEYIAGVLRKRFPKTEISVGDLAVTLKFSDAEIQLLPAVSCKSRIQISNESGRDWLEIDPAKFASTLSETNRNAGYKVVPTIKLAKAIVANLPERQRISGYHAESLAVEVFQNYRGELTTRAMLGHYFEEAAKLVRQPTRDRTGQSLYIDDHLGDSGSLERSVISDALARVGRRIANAEAAGSLDDWKRLFGG